MSSIDVYKVNVIADFNFFFALRSKNEFVYRYANTDHI